MTDPHLTKKEKNTVFAGASSVILGWTAFSLQGFVALLVLGLGISGQSSHVRVQGAAVRLFIGATALLFVSGISYLLLFYRVKCRRCGFALLRNPKGLGPTDLVTNPSSPKARGFSAWGYQMVEVVRRHKIRCLKCGEEYKLA